MRVLTLDIETSPNLGYVWSLWKQNIGLSQLKESGEVICFAAKWLDDPEVLFYSNYTDGGHDEMVRQAHRLLSEADVVVHYNGGSFDIPHLNREFLKLGLAPPRPYKQVDLLKVARKIFRFVSNKLDYVAQFLGLPGKTPHEGFTLWLRCMAGDPEAWAIMEEYNRNDVVITEQAYLKLLPWIPNPPHPGLYEFDPAIHVAVPTCQRCGSKDLTKQGFAYTTLAAYQQWKCKTCGSWSRSARREFGVDQRGVS